MQLLFWEQATNSVKTMNTIGTGSVPPRAAQWINGVLQRAGLHASPAALAVTDNSSLELILLNGECA